jgi:hypothetical protein
MGVAPVMSSLVSRIVMAAVASFTMTMFLAVSAAWVVQQTGYSAPLGVLCEILLPATFLLSATVLEYLEDGNIGRSLKISLLYAGIATALIIGLYFVASPRPRLGRNPQRFSPVTERVAPHIPINPLWKSQLA